MTTQTPPLMGRLVPLLAFVYVVAGIRLGLDFWDRTNAFWFGTYFTIPLALAYIGLGRRWGEVRWTTMAGTLLLVGLLGLLVANSIAYTTGQFMGWPDGRFPDPADSTGGKILAGLSNGALSGAGAGTAWCLIWGTLLIWLPVRCCPRK